jgi:hypothetical protein
MQTNGRARRLAGSWGAAMYLGAAAPMAGALPLPAAASIGQGGSVSVTSMRDLLGRIQVGDIVFIRVPAGPFVQIASLSETWTNHVGIVIDTHDDEPVVAESAVPFSRTVTFSRFANRSAGGRIAVVRLVLPLTDEQRQRVLVGATRRLGILYDTGFNLHSSREFCSRFVREVVMEATGTELGEVETFGDLLARHPDADQGFWRMWFFGRIPWQRETVTPASLLRSPLVETVFDGAVETVPRLRRFTSPWL